MADLLRADRADGDRPGGGLVPAHGLEQAGAPGGLALLAGGVSGRDAAFPRAFARHLTPRIANSPRRRRPAHRSPTARRLTRPRPAMQIPGLASQLRNLPTFAARFDANLAIAPHPQVHDSIAALKPACAAGLARMAMRTSASRQ